MTESKIQELNTQFNNMDLKSENKNPNMMGRKNDCFVNEMCKHFVTEQHCMPQHTLTDSRDIKNTCSSSGGNLYADIDKDDVLKEILHLKLICPRECEELPNTTILDKFERQHRNIKPMQEEDYGNYQLRKLPHFQENFRKATMNVKYLTNYNPYQPHDKAAMQNLDYKFNDTTSIKSARVARLKQLLNTIDCGNCRRSTFMEGTNRFVAVPQFKRKNVQRTEY